MLETLVKLTQFINNAFVVPKVVKAVQGRVPVFLDGGVRRGTDVFKALALGASGIFVSEINVHITPKPKSRDK